MLSPSTFGARGGGEEEVDAETLLTISQETGAKTSIIVGDGKSLRQACESMSNELRERYLSPDLERGGYSNLCVDIPTHPDVTVRVRKSTTVGELHPRTRPTRRPDRFVHRLTSRGFNPILWGCRTRQRASSVCWGKDLSYRRKRDLRICANLPLSFWSGNFKYECPDPRPRWGEAGTAVEIACIGVLNSK
jgi:hypothetical protein